MAIARLQQLDQMRARDAEQLGGLLGGQLGLDRRGGDDMAARHLVQDFDQQAEGAVGQRQRRRRRDRPRGRGWLGQWPVPGMRPVPARCLWGWLGDEVGFGCGTMRGTTSK